MQQPTPFYIRLCPQDVHRSGVLMRKNKDNSRQRTASRRLAAWPSTHTRRYDKGSACPALGRGRHVTARSCTFRWVQPPCGVSGHSVTVLYP